LVIGGGLGFLAFRAARQWPAAANLAALFGVATTVILTVVIPVCDAPSAIAAGSAAVGIVMATPTAARFVSGEAQSRAERLADEAQKVPWDFPGLVRALQIAMLMFMGFLVLVAFTETLETMVRALLLVFAGVGLTATASLKPEISLRNAMTFAGLVISLIGSYLQIDHIFDVGYIIAAVGVVVFVPFTIFAFHSNRIVPIVTVPIAAAFLVMSFITLIIALPAIFIVSGCRVGEEPVVTTFGFLGIVVIASGIATFVILMALLVIERRQNPPYASGVQEVQQDLLKNRIVQVGRRVTQPVIDDAP